MNLEKIKKEYANEDLEILEENGGMAIADTQHGCLHLSLPVYEGKKVYTITWNMGQNMFQTPDRSEAQKFIMDSYIIE